MDKNKCMTKVTGVRASVMASKVTRARRVLSCLGLMMLLGVSQVAAQNEGNVKKITLKELIPENVIPKDSLSSSDDDKNISDKIISEDFNKKAGIPVFGKSSPYYN